MLSLIWVEEIWGMICKLPYHYLMGESSKFQKS